MAIIGAIGAGGTEALRRSDVRADAQQRSALERFKMEALTAREQNLARLQSQLRRGEAREERAHEERMAPMEHKRALELEEKKAKLRDKYHSGVDPSDARMMDILVERGVVKTQAEAFEKLKEAHTNPYEAERIAAILTKTEADTAYEPVDVRQVFKDYLRMLTKGAGIVGGKMGGMPAPAAGSMGKREPPQAAIDYLINNPATAPMFEKHYGLESGSAQQYLKK